MFGFGMVLASGCGSKSLMRLGGCIAAGAGMVLRPLRAVQSGTILQPDGNRLCFLLGLLVAPWCGRLVAPLRAATVDVGTVALVIAGRLVGVGVRMGNGCTSGHGVCGLSRSSQRSLVNVLAFMAAGFATAFVLRHLL